MQQQSGLRWVSGSKTPKKVYITRVMNFGTREEWDEMKRTYSQADILEALREPLRGQWTKHGKAFAEKIFDVTLPENVLISYGPNEQ